MKHHILKKMLIGLVICMVASCSMRGEGYSSDENNVESLAKIAVMCFNLRMNYKDDGPNNWIFRREWDADLIHYYNPDLIGVQESYFPQYLDLKTRLSDYKSFGPVKGRQGAESEAVFYKKRKFELIRSGTFWLSQTPEKRSLGWNGTLYRTVTWGKFRMKANDKVLFFFSTQFPFKEDTARMESVKLLINSVKEIAGNTLAFVVGDLNFSATGKFYKRVTNKGGEPGPLYDAYKLAAHRYGPVWTRNAFGKVPVEKRTRIDYIFTNQVIDVLSYVNISERRGAVFPSDHNPQMAIFKVK